MTIYINGHDYHYETEALVRLFYPNEKIIVTRECDGEREKPYIYTFAEKHNGNMEFKVYVCFEDFEKEGKAFLPLSDDEFDKNAEKKLAVCLYDILCEYSGKKQPWGILTGVRPVKLFRRYLEKYGEEYARDYFLNEFKVSQEKINLCGITEKYERKILSLSKANSFSLYISIPFCPSRCSYCSFVSQTVERAKRLINPYYELLCKEIIRTSEIVKEKSLQLESVYIGGGTPTTLNPEQLSGLIKIIKSCFDMTNCREFTIEAGRPDTITKEKLDAILSGGVDRISINPQTLNDDVLNVIGRRHDSQQTIQAYNLAREMGFKHINMDLIAGLPTDTVDSFIKTLDEICTLSPASVTVHTLSLKRSSKLTLEKKGINTANGINAAKMLEYSEKKLTSSGYHPYYLYRQTRMEGNLENVGWAKEGFDGIYNVFVMDETHTIIGCGAGAVTKLKVPESDSLTRIFNYKYPYEYINDFDEMLERKEQVRKFYDELS